MSPYPRLFEPISLGKVVLPNRITMAAMSSHFAAADGSVTPQHLAYYRERAVGGLGAITVEYNCVDRTEGLAETLQMSLDSRLQLPGHHRLVDLIRHTGTRAFLQLHHAGRETFAASIGGRQPVSPSPARYPLDSGAESRAFVAAEIEELIEKFAFSASLAMDAGYEGIELHGAHGYLLHQFFSPLTNRRDDDWGGDFERRMRFPIAVTRAVRAVLGPDRPLLYRLSAGEFYEGGFTIEDIVRFAPHLVAAGVDCISVSSGIMETVDRVVDPMSMEEGWRLPLARRVKDAVDVPVMATGPFRHPELAERALAEGMVDIIALGRPLLADPQWANKARRGRDADIRHCTSCNWCVGRREKGTGCAENPRTGRELDQPIARFGVGRTAVVAGAGPGGVVAAVLLDQAGFKVKLIEAGPALGGGLIASAAPPFKDKLTWYLDYLGHRMAESHVELLLNTRADLAMVLALDPDVVIVATGAQPLHHAIGGIGQTHVLSAYDLLMAPQTGDVVAARPGPIVVYGGGETGCETAEFLTERGAEVVLVTRSPADQLARSAEKLYRKALVARLAENPRLTIVAESRITRIHSDRVEVTDAAGVVSLLACAQFILAQGRATGGDLVEPLRDAGVLCYAIGDMREIRRIGDAVSDAYMAVMALSEQVGITQLAC